MSPEKTARALILLLGATLAPGCAALGARFPAAFEADAPGVATPPYEHGWPFPGVRSLLASSTDPLGGLIVLGDLVPSAGLDVLLLPYDLTQKPWARDLARAHERAQDERVRAWHPPEPATLPSR